jgi:hypothetical protein
MGARFRLRAANAGGPSDRPVLFPGFCPGLPFASLREAERRIGATNVGAPFGRRPPAACEAGAPTGAPPRRFLTQPPYFFAGPRSVDSHVIQAALAPPFIQARRSHSRQPPHRGRTVTAPPGTGLRNHPPAGAAIPAPPTGRHRKTPSVSGDGCTICKAERPSILIPSLQGLSTLRPQPIAGPGCILRGSCANCRWVKRSKTHGRVFADGRDEEHSDSSGVRRT